MVDSQRLRSTPEGIRLVSEAAAELAHRGDGRTSVLATATYFPVDVDSVARVFEAIEAIDGVERIQEGTLTLYEIEDSDRFARPGPDVSQASFIHDSSGFVRALATLKGDAEWVRQVQAQHQLLRIVADSGRTTLELSYLTSRTQMSRARVQSLLNDFDAQGFLHVEVDEEMDKIRYVFPPIDYPAARFDQNMALLEDVDPPVPSRSRSWIALAVVALIILGIVIWLRF